VLEMQAIAITSADSLEDASAARKKIEQQLGVRVLPMKILVKELFLRVTERDVLYSFSREMEFHNLKATLFQYRIDTNNGCGYRIIQPVVGGMGSESVHLSIVDVWYYLND
jgi:hypothetical protein